MQNLNYDDNSRFYFNKELNKWVIEIKSIIEISRNSDLHQVLSQMNQIKDTPYSDPVIETTPKKKSQEISCLQEFEDLFESKNNPVDYLTAIGNILEPESKPSSQKIAIQQTKTTVKKQKINNIEYKGFTFNKTYNKYQAYLRPTKGSTTIWLGYYLTEETARHANLRARLEYRTKGSVKTPFNCPTMGYFFKNGSFIVSFFNPVTKKTESHGSYETEQEAIDVYLEALESILA
jgi:hypothetical protein